MSYSSVMYEIWKDVPNTDGKYKVSNLGRVRSFNTREGVPRILKPAFNRHRNYHYISVQVQQQRRKNWILHRLVAEVFIPNTDNSLIVDHVDGVKTNNRIDNLEWVTYKENSQRAIRLGLIPGYDHLKSAKLLTPDKAIEIYKEKGLHRDIAIKYNIGVSTVTHIKLGSRWGKYTNSLT